MQNKPPHNKVLNVNELQSLSPLFATLIKNLPISLIKYDLNCKRILVHAYCSPEPANTTYFEGKSPLEAWDSDILSISAYEFQSRLQQVMQTGISQNFEVVYEKKEQRYIGSLDIVAEFDAHQKIVGALALYNDITEISQYRTRLEHLAFHDLLTDLPNRALLNDRLQVAIDHAARQKNLFGLLILDLDEFKNINDSAGHAVGDLLLSKTAQRILSAVRGSDLVARIGGDEFAVLVTDIQQLHDLANLAQKIGTCLADPFNIEGASFFVTVSIGIACYPEDSDNIADLMKYADTAMYHAKKKGRNTYQFYSPDLTLSVTERLMIETELRYAIEKNEFSLAFQAFVDMRTGQINGAEALLRWDSIALGQVLPEKFIPIAEDSGLIIEIGDWVLYNACEFAVKLNTARKQPLRIAINLSSRQLINHDVHISLVNFLRMTNCEPTWITLEITESLLLQDSDDVLKKLNYLHDIGISVAIDDFGTGYSALAYLNKFPISQVKIDRSFVHHISIDKNAALLVKAIIAMAQSLNKTLTAEGVETVEQMNLLNSFGCHQAQGFLFSAALPYEEFCKLLEKSSI